MRRIFRTLFFLAVFLPAQPSVLCQTFRISGSGKGYGKTEMKVYRLSEPVTKSLIPLSRVTCDTSGHFSLSLSMTPHETIVFKTGIYSLTLYIDTARDLVLKLPDYVARNDEDRQNSFFEETAAVPEVVNHPGDINNLMRSFDLIYDPLFNRIADRIMYNTKKNDIPGLMEKLNALSSPGMADEFSDFVRYRMIMLNQVAGGEYPGRKEDSMIVNSAFHPWNRAYTDLLEQMFTKYFRALAGGNCRDKFSGAIADGSVPELKNVIRLEGKAVNEQLEEYIIILNLFNEYFDTFIRHDKILSMLNSLSQSASSEYLRNLADNVSKRLTSLGDNTVPPELSLRKENGELFSLQELKGKYVLLSFGQSDNAFSVSEYGILKGWAGRFAKDLSVVTVLRDSDYRAGLDRMHSMGFNWIILDGSAADLEEYEYNVTIYPSFILLDRSGKIALRQCPFPSENLEKVFGKRIEDESANSAPEN